MQNDHPLTPTLSPAAGEREKIRAAQHHLRNGNRFQNGENGFPVPIRWAESQSENFPNGFAPWPAEPSLRRDRGVPLPHRGRGQGEGAAGDMEVHGELRPPTSDADRGHERSSTFQSRDGSCYGRRLDFGKSSYLPVHGKFRLPGLNACPCHEPTKGDCELHEVRNHPGCAPVHGKSGPPILDAHRSHEPDVREIAELINSAIFACPIRLAGSFDLQFLDAHCGLEPVSGRKCYTCSVFFRDSVFDHRFMGGFDEQALAHRDHEPPAKDHCGVGQLRNDPRRQFMGSFDLQLRMRIAAMNVARLSKVETGRAKAADSTLESRATCRFMESFDLQFLDAHPSHEPTQCNDQLSMHMHQKLGHAHRPISVRFMGRGRAKETVTARPEPS